MYSAGVITLLILAAFGDTFILSGYIFYGSLVAASATTALLAGYHPALVGLACFSGCVIGELINLVFSKELIRSKFFVNNFENNRLEKHFLNTRFGIGVVLSKAQKTRIGKYISTLVKFLFRPRAFVAQEKFYITILKSIAGRFMATARPLNAYFIIQSHGYFRSMVSLATAAAIWVVFWLYIFQYVSILIKAII